MICKSVIKDVNPAKFSLFQILDILTVM